ncbi:glycosyltransferase family 1 protein [Streptococcus suis]|uniref:Glycosyltransferase family 1 protein n=1 Tax=Streptococcus suis TaxID=1307 RepID=A0A9X4MWY6_STRSU|nr:glycosyltransferase family 1 protein [Streptococcus suis]MDG4527539.1 glycosyltransferase family 1 protein [Streptococcus suis]MDG4529852.1 glycosyltransferase family 1 protein [Streptococcus suis]
MKKLKIAHIMGKWLGGGVESTVLNYLRAIDTNQVEFHLLCDSDSKDIPYEIIEKLGGKVRIIPPYQQLITYSRTLTHFLKQEQFDIVHSHINTLSVFPLRCAYKAGVPVRIAHSHTTTSPKEFKRNLLKRILRLFSTRYATHYFACSKEAGVFQFGKKNLSSVTIVNNAMDKWKFYFNAQNRSEIRKRLGIQSEQVLFGHVGRFSPQKNQFFIIHLFHDFHLKNENAKLMLIGEGKDKAKCIEECEKLGLQERVVFVDNVQNVEAYYSAMDVFLFPSLYEGFGMVLVEAQLSGLPCLASSAVPTTTKISEQVTYISTKEPNIWLEIMFKMAENIDTDSRLENIYRLEQLGLDIEIEAKKLLNVYKGAMGEKGITIGRD